ncbi:MAG: glycosyltransferase family 39 protein [Kiritimatiellae bacterium]|nr:glycosyltransferase family 39 protein [Kiritimatiellia bacterium]MDW8458473.1 glycosyltransferase family 39 protein [Verrucomicrobiota bacterium]
MTFPTSQTAPLPVAIIASGVILLILWQVGIYPLALAGRLLSADHELSAETVARMATGQVWAALALVATGLTALFRRGIVSPRTMMGAPRVSAPAFLALLMLGGALSAAISFHVLFDSIPHVTDAISHFFQAKIFAGGELVAAAPPCPLAFFQHHVLITNDGKWFTKYPPGHALLLAIGQLLGYSNAALLLAHLLVLVASYFLARSFFTESVARATAAAFAVSPLAILLAGSMMSHTTFLASFLTGSWALVSALHMPRAPFLNVLAGFAYGLSFLIRPHEFLISAAAVATGLLLSAPRAVLEILRSSRHLLMGFLPAFVAILLWNQKAYGHWAAIGYGFTTDQSLFPMFQSRFGVGEHFKLADAAQLSLHRLIRFDQALLGWPLTLPLLGFAFLRVMDRRVRFLVIATAVHVGVYFFYDYLGHEYEARYYYNLAPVMLVLLAFGLREWAGASPARRFVVLAVVVASFAHAVGAYWPQVVFRNYGPDYEQANRCLHERALRELPPSSLVLIDSGAPEIRFRYSSGFLFNDPALTGRVIYARGEYLDLVPCLVRAFADRRFYRYVADPNDWCNGRFVPVEVSPPAGSE